MQESNQFAIDRSYRQSVVRIICIAVSGFLRIYFSDRPFGFVRQQTEYDRYGQGQSVVPGEKSIDSEGFGDIMSPVRQGRSRSPIIRHENLLITVDNPCNGLLGLVHIVEFKKDGSFGGLTPRGYQSIASADTDIEQ